MEKIYFESLYNFLKNNLCWIRCDSGDGPYWRIEGSERGEVNYIYFEFDHNMKVENIKDEKKLEQVLSKYSSNRYIIEMSLLLFQKILLKEV